MSVERAAALLGKIDSGERSVFEDTAGTEQQICARFWEDGVFYACRIWDEPRMHVAVALAEDTDRHNDEIARCIREAREKVGDVPYHIWVRNENRKVVEFLKETFRIPPEGKHDYASVEFVARREGFGRVWEGDALEARPYEDRHIDAYLELLDGAMTFADPPPNFRGGKDYFLGRFAELAKADSFEAFWKDGELIGLYWREGREIDTLAVSAKRQRGGYGTAILILPPDKNPATERSFCAVAASPSSQRSCRLRLLPAPCHDAKILVHLLGFLSGASITRAIEMVFARTDADFARLYAVDWNEKGQNFYKKYGMEASGHSYLLKPTCS